METPNLLTLCLGAAEKTILSVGSGDGSQQAAIVKRGHRRMLVTFFDSRRRLLQKYPHAEETLSYLEQHCDFKPLFQIDATKLEPELFKMQFDLIMFTFPHTGIPNNDPVNVSTNQALLRGFLSAAPKILGESGEIHITLKNGQHYERWDLPSLLRETSHVTLAGSERFDPSMFPGYTHRMTKGNQEVVDRKGAQVHIFRPETAQVRFPSAIYLVQPPPSLAWADDQIWEMIATVLNTNESPLNVLQIRRRLDVEPIPDTRQLNRVLYSRDCLVRPVSSAKTKRKSRSQKPCWVLRSLNKDHAVA